MCGASPATGFGLQEPKESTLGTLSFVDAEPKDACSPLTNAEAIKGAVALVARGSCYFQKKTQAAIEAGAIAVSCSPHRRFVRAC